MVSHAGRPLVLRHEQLDGDKLLGDGLKCAAHFGLETGIISLQLIHSQYGVINPTV